MIWEGLMSESAMDPMVSRFLDLIKDANLSNSFKFFR